MNETINSEYVTLVFTKNDGTHVHTMSNREYTAMVLLAQVGATVLIFGGLVAIEKATPLVSAKFNQLKRKLNK